MTSKHLTNRKIGGGGITKVIQNDNYNTLTGFLAYGNTVNN